MKHFQFILPLIASALLLFSCNEEGSGSVENKTKYKVDHSDPAMVLQAVFDVAKGADPNVLAGLCDPEGQNDNDTRRICDLADGFAANDEFVLYFAHAKLNGPPLVEGTLASVPFLFGPNGDREEVMEMVERDGKWYLKSF
jgi:hypothetical protein